jgi:uncharacterized protein (TIGR02996 family)
LSRKIIVSQLSCFFDAIVEAGSAVALRLIRADWLDEHDRPYDAELMRLHGALLTTCCEPNQHPECVRQQTRVVELLAAGVRPCRTIARAKGVDRSFAWIPSGTFLMGSPSEELERGENDIQHGVLLTHGFYLGIHAVTQRQWQAVMGKNPSHAKGEPLPVESVSWKDCQKFRKKLCQRDGKRFPLPTERGL